jgi:hypothetical protein
MCSRADVLEHIEIEFLDAVRLDLKEITRNLGFFSVHTGARVNTRWRPSGLLAIRWHDTVATGWIPPVTAPTGADDSCCGDAAVGARVRSRRRGDGLKSGTRGGSSMSIKQNGLIVLALAAAAFASPADAAGPKAKGAETPTYKVINKISGPDGGGWDLSTVDPKTRRRYVSRPGGIMMIELDTGKVAGKFAEGAGVHGILPIPGTRELVSANEDTNSAMSFDEGSGVPARLGAFDPKTGRIYLPTAEAKAIPDPGQRRTLIPGTFRSWWLRRTEIAPGNIGRHRLAPAADVNFS